MLFDATQVPPSTGEFDPLPNNRYLMQVTDGEMKSNPGEGKSGISLKLTVMEGEHQGKSFFQYYNMQNPSATAQRIGQAEFSALCHATGVLQPRAIDDLKDRPFYGDVVVTPPSSKKQQDGTIKNYDAGNSVKKYYRPDGTDMKGVVAGTITPGATAPAATRKGAAPSWVQGAKAS